MKRENIKYPYLTRPVEVITFDNGHRLVLAHKKSTMVNISTWVATGSINENVQNNGVSHFLEHLMFKGTHKYKAGEFDRILERKGGIINAATWKDYTFYYVTIPVEEFDLALHLHADMMIDPVLPEEEIGSPFEINGNAPKDKRERCVVIEEIRMGQDRNWRKVYNVLNDAMYEKHPYKRDVIGSAEIISAISREEIMRYYKSFYTPFNMTTVIVGDFEFEYAIKKVQEEFNFQKFDCFEPLIPDKKEIETSVKNPKTIEKTAHINTGFMMWGFLCGCPKNLKETIALDLLTTILGDGKSSRLNTKLIENVKEPYVYEVQASHYQFKDGDNFMIDINFNADKKDTVLSDIKNELETLSNISEEEVQKAKKFAKVNFAQEAETVSSIGDMIGEFMTVFGDLSLANEYLFKLDEIDNIYLQETAKKYLSPELAAVSILMPEAK
ncbi:MAG: insulinase family protein [Candidatus Gastranaerophilales bacterium]|nr:insulinase family protein [Candidatus Gastranaerophilales bacterium]